MEKNTFIQQTHSDGDTNRTLKLSNNQNDRNKTAPKIQASRKDKNG